MIDKTNKSVILMVLLAITFFSERNAFNDIVKGGWKASPKLVEKLSQRRSETNYVEEKVPQYTLPNPLVMVDGTRVTDAQTWRSQRRPEILDLFRTHVYGRSPMGKPANMVFEVFDLDREALGGSAVRRQIAVYFTGVKEGPKMDILLYLPKNTKKPVPTFTLLNFGGNHTVHTDPAIKLSESWMRPGQGVENHRASEESRGKSSSSFPIRQILRRGYGIATVYYGDIDPDFHDGFKNGIHPAFDKGRASDAWGSIGAWAWGLSRIMDYFETDTDVDQDRIVVLGHSRLGKTALWAGAQDQRFAIVISNNSGCGGAALSRRAYGETVKRINTSFPHWFCENFKKFNDREEELPVDQHMLIALMAPRPVYVASADEDLWADPFGEFLSCKHAEPVYQLLGEKGLSANQMPGLNQPLKEGKVGYHVRTGGHALTEYDWSQYMDFADRHFGRSQK